MDGVNRAGYYLNTMPTQWATAVEPSIERQGLEGFQNIKKSIQKYAICEAMEIAKTLVKLNQNGNRNGLLVRAEFDKFQKAIDGIVIEGLKEYEEDVQEEILKQFKNDSSALDARGFIEAPFYNWSMPNFLVEIEQNFRITLNTTTAITSESFLLGRVSLSRSGRSSPVGRPQIIARPLSAQRVTAVGPSSSVYTTLVSRAATLSPPLPPPLPLNDLVFQKVKTWIEEFGPARAKIGAQALIRNKTVNWDEALIKNKTEKEISQLQAALDENIQDQVVKSCYFVVDRERVINRLKQEGLLDAKQYMEQAFIDLNADEFLQVFSEISARGSSLPLAALPPQISFRSFSQSSSPSFVSSSSPFQPVAPNESVFQKIKTWIEEVMTIRAQIGAADLVKNRTVNWDEALIKQKTEREIRQFQASLDENIKDQIITSCDQVSVQEDVINRLKEEGLLDAKQYMEKAFRDLNADEFLHVFPSIPAGGSSLALATLPPHPLQTSFAFVPTVSGNSSEMMLIAQPTPLSSSSLFSSSSEEPTITDIEVDTGYHKISPIIERGSETEAELRMVELLAGKCEHRGYVVGGDVGRNNQAQWIILYDQYLKFKNEKDYSDAAQSAFKRKLSGAPKGIGKNRVEEAFGKLISISGSFSSTATSVSPPPSPVAAGPSASSTVVLNNGIGGEAISRDINQLREIVEEVAQENVEQKAAIFFVLSEIIQSELKMFNGSNKLDLQSELEEVTLRMIEKMGM